MIAARDLKNTPRIGKQSLLDVFHPGPIHADSNVILGFARNGAGVASDALAVIDDEAVLHGMKITN